MPSACEDQVIVSTMTQERIRQLAKECGSLLMLLFHTITLNIFRGLSSGSEHKSLKTNPLYREAIASETLHITATEREALRVDERIERVERVQDNVIKWGAISLTLGSVLLTPEVRLLNLVGGVAFFLGIAMMLAGFATQALAVAYSKKIASELSSIDHKVRKYICHIESIAKHEAADASSVATSAAGAFVLYLRSFDADFEAAALTGWLTEEEQLVKVLASVGKIVAVGRPGEPLPEVGASRVYFTNAEWQARVGEMIDSAVLIVIRAGRTPGLAWEAARVGLVCSPMKLLVMGEDRCGLSDVVNVILQSALAPNRRLPWLRWKKIGSIAGIVSFNSDWSLNVLPLRRATFRKVDDDGPLVARFILTLRPVLLRFSSDYKIPEVEEAFKFVAVFVGLFFLWGLGARIESWLR